MTVLLYDNPVSGNRYKVRLLLGPLGIEFERRELSVVDRSDRVEALAEGPAPRRWLDRVASRPGIVPITA